jgi:hypothetical protein
MRRQPLAQRYRANTTTEGFAMTDCERKAARECLGIVESIADKLRADVLSDRIKEWAAVGDLNDIYRVLSDIEDRVYQSGEYAA